MSFQEYSNCAIVMQLMVYVFFKIRYMAKMFNFLFLLVILREVITIIDKILFCQEICGKNMNCIDNNM